MCGVTSPRAPTRLGGDHMFCAARILMRRSSYGLHARVQDGYCDQSARSDRYLQGLTDSVHALTRPQLALDRS